MWRSELFACPPAMPLPSKFILVLGRKESPSSGLIISAMGVQPPSTHTAPQSIVSCSVVVFEVHSASFVPISSHAFTVRSRSLWTVIPSSKQTATQSPKVVPELQTSTLCSNSPQLLTLHTSFGLHLSLVETPQEDMQLVPVSGEKGGSSMRQLMRSAPL